MPEESDLIKNYLGFENRLRRLYWKKNPTWYLKFKKFADEKFEEIEGYYGFYFISNYGQVVSFHHKSPRIKRFQLRHGYLSAILNLSICRNCYIHNLVYEAFVGDVKPGYRVIHKNNITTDNYYKNLKLVKLTHSTRVIRDKILDFSLYKRVEAEAPQFKFNTSVVLQFDWEGRYIQEYPSLKAASESTGISIIALSQCLNGKYLSSGGFQWRFPNDPLFKNGIVNIGPVPEYAKTDRKALLKFDLEGKFLKEYSSVFEACIEHGLQHSNIAKCIQGKIKSCGGFQWKYKNDPRFDNGVKAIEPVVYLDYNKKEPVLQFDLEGKFLKKFDSTAQAASELNVPIRYLTNCLKGNDLAYRGFQWRYQMDLPGNMQEGTPNIESVKNKVIKRFASIYQFSFTGKFIREYPSVKEAANKIGIKSSNIRACLLGERKTSGGFQWRASDDHAFKEGIHQLEPVRYNYITAYQPVMQFDKEGNFVKEYDTAREAAKETRISLPMIRLCLKGVICSSGGFQWKKKEEVSSICLKKGEYKISPYPYGKKNKSQKETREILQFDLEGKFIKKYNSIVSAAQIVGNSPSTISGSLRDPKTAAYGFQWRYADNPEFKNKIVDIDPFVKRRSRKPLPVVQFHLNGKFIREYSSVTQARKITGVTNRAIIKCAEKEKPVGGGFHWRYRSDPIFKEGIRDIPPVQLKVKVKPVLQFDLLGNFLAEYPTPANAVAAVGVCRNSLFECLRGKARTACKCQWRWKSDPIFCNGIVNIGKVEKVDRYNHTPVLQFDREGKFIRQYPNINEAAKDLGIHSDLIRRNFKRETKTAGGYQWRTIHDPLFKNGITDIAPAKISGNPKSRPVVQLDLENNPIREFPSIHRAAIKLGISPLGIADCAKGKQKTCAGFKWKFK